MLTVYVDARTAHCTGWWYEGGGIFRNTYLLSTSRRVRLPSHGVFVSTTVPKSGYSYPALPREGITAAAAAVTARATVDGDGDPMAGGAAAVEVTFTVLDRAGKAVVSKEVSATRVPGNVSATLALQNAEVWSVARPYLYTLSTTVRVSGAVADATNTSFGVRGVEWSATTGLLLNEQVVKMRGFCEHENSAGVGSAIPERVNLLRLQQMRGVGGEGVSVSSFKS